MRTRAKRFHPACRARVSLTAVSGVSAHMADVRRVLERIARGHRLIATSHDDVCGEISVTSASVRCRIAACLVVFAFAPLAHAELPQLDPAQVLGPDGTD